MGAPTVGSVVIVSYPYGDFRLFKKRPALVVATAEHDCVVLAQITSKSQASNRAIQIFDEDFASGGLQTVSYIRVDKLVTIERASILHIAGKLNSQKTTEISNSLQQLFKHP